MNKSVMQQVDVTFCIDTCCSWGYTCSLIAVWVRAFGWVYGCVRLSGCVGACVGASVGACVGVCIWLGIWLRA